MISGIDFIERLTKQFHEFGFAPYSDVQSVAKKKKELSLHQGIRTALNMRDDDSIYMYWEWRELKSSFDAMWKELDLAASRLVDRTTSAIAVCSRPGLKLDNLINLLHEVDCNNLLAFPTAVRRPTKSEGQVRFIGKRLGAILMTLGIVAETTESGYGDLLSSVADAGDSEVELLDHLDGVVRREFVDLHQARPPSQVVILRALGWAYEEVNKMRAKEDLPEFNFLEFLRETESNANWSGLSDQFVLKRLLLICPENADASKKAIEKFLSN